MKRCPCNPKGLTDILNRVGLISVELMQDLAVRLENRASEAAELRTRLELTARQSTVEEERNELRERVGELQADLEAERKKGFWRRMFGS